MANSWGNTTGGCSFRFFSPEEVDQILCDGARRGRAGSHAAIERILKHESGLERADLWRRIRQLKSPSQGPNYRRSVWGAEDEKVLRDGYESGGRGKQEAVRELLKRHPDWRPHIIWRRAARLRLVRKISRRGEERSRLAWSEDEDRILLNLAGYKTTRFISKMLHRSEAAVRYRLTLSGKSGRVHLEGFARYPLAADLHLASGTIQRLIVEGLLEVRDPRVTRESLDGLRKSDRLAAMQQSNAQASDHLTQGLGGERSALAVGEPATRNLTDLPTTSAKRSRANRVWAEVARSLSVSAETVEKLIARGILKLYDPTITEKSFRNFCRRYGAMINYDFLNRETREWLQSSMDLVRNAGESAARRLTSLRKHARVVRRCTCGRTIRGNAFFRHIKRCGNAKSQGIKTAFPIDVRQQP